MSRGAFRNGRTVWWEAALVIAAMAAALALGIYNLGGPSLWHDEAVQVYVANSLLATGRPLLPSGHVHPVAPVYNAIMAAFIGVFGDAERVVRLPSVLFAVLNVGLTFLLVRPLLGRATAVLAAVALALSPWSVAWSREARFYTSQQTFYLLTLACAWRLMESREGRRAAAWAVFGLSAYLLGLGTSLHSVLFLAPVVAYGALMAAYERRPVSRWSAYAGAAAAIGVATMAVYWLTLPKADSDAIFTSAGIGLQVRGSETPVLYYVNWLRENLGTGFFILALAGTVLLPLRERRRGAYSALAFWAPVLAMTFLLGYRRHRFMFFAYPMYVAAFSYAVVVGARWIAATTRRIGPIGRIGQIGLVLIAGAIAVFGARTAISGVLLLQDSLRTSAGSDITLATRHPQWRAPCQYVKEHLEPDVAVVTCTWVTALYYVGRVDNWYPSRHFLPESWETGNEGLRNIEDLAAYMTEHPRGYLIVELFRFWHFNPAQDDVAWVNAHMQLIEEASSGDVRVYAWGMS
ncbi:MAG: glycosyltransferase family 39 protein [Candidatus Hydrogenedentes bacterium]|nr:glycosyltransferase family 39 protein [Candidatus Hydrogenedentota bacterium]